MGVILDSSILIAGERRRDSVWEVLQRVEAVCGTTASALSAVTVVELTHGIYRAKSDADRERRESFCEELYQAVAVHPLTLEIARLASQCAVAGRIQQRDIMGNEATPKMQKFDRITVDPARMNGEPCVRDLRLTVRRVLEALATYPDREELKREYPELEDEDIRQALAFAAGMLDDKILPLPV
jgi:uncharacterized protein (DUF433 family)/predicted nucleic acid-binding protein